MPTSNSLRQRLLGGAKSYGPMILSDSPVAAEILALTGYGHIVIDHEHAVTDIRSGQALLQAIQATHALQQQKSQIPTEPIVRVPGPDDPVYMKKVLDSLPMPGGILVPMVDTVEAARAVVASTRYPRQQQQASSNSSNSTYLEYPDGIRGCAAPFVRASAWGHDPNYVARCQDSDLLVMVQVETPQGVKAIPDIAAVPGVDAIFLGPLDLSCSIGKMGQFQDPQVKDLLAQAEAAVKATNCLLAGFRPMGRSTQDMLDAGYSLICGSADVGLLKEAARQDWEEAQAALSCFREQDCE